MIHFIKNDIVQLNVFQMLDYTMDCFGESSFIQVFLLVNSQPLKFDVLDDLTVIPALMPKALNKIVHRSSVL